MLRHLDAAWEVRGTRRLVGFFLVEGRDPDGTSVPDDWAGFVRDTVAEGASARSLPHRTDEERAAIAGSFVGVATWQALAKHLRVVLP